MPSRSVTKKDIPSLVLALLVPMLVVLLLRLFVIDTYYVPSESMVSTLEIDDKIMVVQPHIETPEKEDIVVFRDDLGWVSQKTGNFVVKRVVAEGGDTIYAENGVVYVNNVAINERYITGSTSDFPLQTVPQGTLFVMGDNRQFSADSRAHIETGTQFVSTDSVTGVVKSIFWPLNRFKVF